MGESNYLVLIVCAECGYDHYFEPDNLPGGEEHCEHCEVCAALLPKVEDGTPPHPSGR